MIQFPYGNADFYKIITRGYYYVDRTNCIPIIENIKDALVFLRPRRFGKTLLLSMLENYYDVQKADEFDRLFGHLAIGANPTPEHNQYVILRWNFSFVSTLGDAQAIKANLYNRLNASVQTFSRTYAPLLHHKIVIDPNDAIASFEHILDAIYDTPYKLYLLIDEYDNFANEIMMGMETTSQQRYEELVQGEGLLKSVFKFLKGAMEGRGLDRIFITGVSPIALNDMTSGFNIAKNITFHPKLADVCGFREDEIVAILHELAQAGTLSPDHITTALDTMRTFYNGYRFVPNHATPLYNPTLALYFLDTLQDLGTFPDNLLDENLELDRSKLTYLSCIPMGNEMIAQIINEDDERPLAISQFANRFGVHTMLYGTRTQEYLLSLLYYFGIVTLTESRDEWGRLVFTIPNNVTRQLYFDHIRYLIIQSSQHMIEAGNVKWHFYQTGDIGPLCEFIEQHYLSMFDNRDYRWTNELTIKAVFITMMHDIWILRHPD